MGTTRTQQNRLATQKSPYLIQHAHNLVDWWPWCDEALHLARTEKKLILLSIGYSACHWCHVMAHESFEDAATAQVMNARFINIKVDREERPDLDKIYQTAHQLLNQHAGGWPLTMILTPDDHIPFFAGTYFPVTEKFDMPAFKDLLIRVDNFYHEHPEQVYEQNQSMQQALNSLEQKPADNSNINSAPLDQARRQLEQQFDNEHAGFGNAPKFPHPSNLNRLLRHWLATQQSGNEDIRAKQMLQLTLHAMAAGGIYDQLAGGFFRYSVDDTWTIPHFEKMLYDNGPLLSLYAQCAIAFDDVTFSRIANETAAWVINEMQSSDGGYYSTLDADSEGEEGKYYLWTPDQIQTHLDEVPNALFAALFGLQQAANFEGQWHLRVTQTLAEVAQQHNIGLAKAQQHIEQAKQILLQQRKMRVALGRDEKILVSWNALMIKGMAQAGRLLQQPRYIQSAQRSCNFIMQHMFVNKRLHAQYKDGLNENLAYLDDYAFLLDALLELLSAEWQNKYLEFAIQLADTLLTHFQDTQQGGFYFTAHDHEQLIQRPKPFSDEAIPAGNAIAAFALARLGHLISNTEYLAASEGTIRCAWNALNQAPYAHAAMLDALEEFLFPPGILLIRGPKKQELKWRQHIETGLSPRMLFFYISNDVTELYDQILAKAPSTERVTAYLCRAQQCLPATHSINELQQQLASLE